MQTTGTENTSRWKVIAAFAAIYLIWGSTYLGIHFAIETIPPLIMAGGRFLIAGGLLYGWMRLKGAPRPKAVHWRSAVIIGGLMLLGGNGGVTWGEQHLASGLAALLVAMVPIWMAALNWLRPNGVRPSREVIIGLVLGFAGVVLLVSQDGIAGGGSPMALVGALVIVVGTIGWAAGSLYSKEAPLPAQPLMGTAVEMLMGGVWLWLVAIPNGDWGQLDLAAISLRSGAAFAYLTLFGSLIAFSAYVFLLRATTPTRAATYAYVNPVVAVVLGWALAGEPLTPRTLIAAVIIIAGVVVTTTYRASARKPELAQAADAQASAD